MPVTNLGGACSVLQLTNIDETKNVADESARAALLSILEAEEDNEAENRV